MNTIESFLSDLEKKPEKAQAVYARAASAVSKNKLTDFVIPAKAGIQFLGSGFRVKPGMTNTKSETDFLETALVSLQLCPNRKRTTF